MGTTHSPLFKIKAMRIEDIKEGLLHVVGWNDDTIYNSLTESTSGIYFQDIHPLLTIENLKSIAPKFKNNTYQQWVTGITYPKGTKVHDDYNYVALSENTSKRPSENLTIWQREDLFSDWLTMKTKSSIGKAMQTLYAQRLYDKTAKSILESKYLFDGCGRLSDTITNTNSTVGFEIVPIRADGVTLKIESIGLQMQGTGDVILKIFHSSQKEPFDTITCTRTKNGSMEWFAQNILLPYVSDENDAGGSWFLVYEQGDNMAINKTIDWSRECLSCNRSAGWVSLSRYLEVHPFRVQESTEELWSIENNIYTSENYGINLKISVVCDITDIILSQSNIFANYIALQVAYDLLKEMAYNPSFRINRTQSNPAFGTLDFMMAIDGDTASYKKSGIGYELSLALKSLNVDLSGMSRVCLPCRNGGIKYRTI